MLFFATSSRVKSVGELATIAAAVECERGREERGGRGVGDIYVFFAGGEAGEGLRTGVRVVIRACLFDASAKE